MSTDPPLTRVNLNGATMGTRYAVTAHVDPAIDARALGRQLHAVISDVDVRMSNWKPDSDISRLNRAPVDQWIEIPSDLFDVLACALAIEAKSSGAFDIGVGETVGAWGFGPLAGTGLPRPVAPRPVTRQALELDRVAGRVRKHAPLSLDLSGIAKGYGVDRLGETLLAAGLRHWLVSIDGELRAGGPKPDGSPWAIGLERPVIGKRELAGVIEIDAMAVATSGTYRHCHAIDGQSVSHTIDPSSGLPLSGKPASVTVLAQTCMEADAWATAILIDGAWPPKRFPSPPEIDAIMLKEAR